jgi:hypothetical protein
VALEAMKNNDLSIALDELKQAAGLAPSNALIWYNIAVVESKKGDSKAALEHLHKATSLGLPSSQQEDVDKLEAKLTYDLKKKTLSEKQPGTPAVPKTTAGARESSMRALNTGINEIGAITADYQPIGFILETSTGKLWWRSLTKSGCEGGRVAIWMSGARLTELDPNSVAEGVDNDGHKALGFACKSGATCVENWASPICWSLEIMGMTAKPPNVQEVINKDFVYTGSQGDVKTTFRFMGRQDALAIDTTGDPDGTQRAINLLKHLITSEQSR